MFASRFSWLMVVKEERRSTGRARVDATGRGADRVCRIPKMLRHQYDSLQCSCDFPSWVGK